MEYYFELFLHVEKLEREDWKALNNVISSQVGTLNEYKIIITVKDNTVRYFIGSFIDLGPLSNNINIGILKPVDRNDIDLPEEPVGKKEKMVIIQQGESVFDIRERYQIKKSLDLEAAVLKVRKINSEKALTKVELYFKDKIGAWSLNSRRLTTLPTNLLSIDFTSSSKYLRSKIGKYLDIQKSLSIMQPENLDAVFETYTFPYLPKNYYLPLTAYDFDKHSFIIGASGTGKSKLITLITEKLTQNNSLKDNYRVVVIDPHASLESDLSHIDNSVIIDFKDEATETELFATSETDTQAATELTSTLFKSLLEDQHNPRLERVLKHTLYVLITAQVMSLENLKRFVTDIEYRNQLLAHVKGFVPDNIIYFFGTDFNELRTKNYNETISPIVSFVEEIQLQPAFGKSNSENNSIGQLINNHSLTVFSLNKISMGEKVVKTVAGLLIQQIFLLAQSRAFSEKIVLIIDEVSVVQNPTISAILSEARKFGLSVVLTQQYFGQIEKDLRDSIFANVMNYYVFKVSEEDAKALEGNLAIDIPEELLKSGKEKGVSQKDFRIQTLTELHPREVLLRLSAAGKLLPCIMARTIDFEPKFDLSPESGLERPEGPPANSHKAPPAKFIEGNAPSQPTISRPSINPVSNGQHNANNLGSIIVDRTTEVPDISTHTSSAPSPQVQEGPKKVSLSLHDLLATQSSSRKNLKK